MTYLDTEHTFEVIKERDDQFRSLETMVKAEVHVALGVLEIIAGSLEGKFPGEKARQVEHYLDLLQEKAGLLDRIADTDQEKQLAGSIQREIADYAATAHQIIALVKQGDARQEISAADSKLNQLAELLEENLETFATSVHEEFNEAAAQMNEEIILADIELAFIYLVTLGLLIPAFIFFARGIILPMRRTVSMIQELEKGQIDSSLKLDTRDEIGQMARAMDDFADSLQNEVVDSLQKLAKGNLPSRSARVMSGTCSAAPLSHWAQSSMRLWPRSSCPASRSPRAAPRSPTPARPSPRAPPSRRPPSKRSAPR